MTRVEGVNCWGQSGEFMIPPNCAIKQTRTSVHTAYELRESVTWKSYGGISLYHFILITIIDSLLIVSTKKKNYITLARLFFPRPLVRLRLRPSSSLWNINVNERIDDWSIFGLYIIKDEGWRGKWGAFVIYIIDTMFVCPTHLLRPVCLFVC